MICRNCNREIPQNTKFCPYCGNKVYLPETNNQQDYVPVSNNQQINTPSAPETPFVNREVIAPKPKKKSNAPIIAVIVVLIIAIAGVTAYKFGLFGGKDDEQTNGNGPSQKTEIENPPVTNGENVLLLSIDPYEYTVYADSYEISGTAAVTEKDAVLCINGKKIGIVPADEETVYWREEIDLQEGENIIRIELSDKEGNVKTKTITIMREVDEENEFLFESDRYYISEYDLYGMTQEEVALIRNEIYARHGYIFNTEFYADYFSQKSWYEPNPDFSEAMLNDIEKANKDFLVQYEKDRGWR